MKDRELKVSNCKDSELNKVERHRWHASPAPESGWILIENRKHKLAWTSCCIKENCCNLCDTNIGWAFIESTVNEELFGKYECADVKVIGRIESI